MRLVIIESPFAHPSLTEHMENITYARAAMRDSLLRGEAPIASHLIYTQSGVLDDALPEERKRGIEAGFAWGACATAIIFYTDRGWSRGMLAAYNHYTRVNETFTEHPFDMEFRSLHGQPVPPPQLIPSKVST